MAVAASACGSGSGQEDSATDGEASSDESSTSPPAVTQTQSVVPWDDVATHLATRRGSYRKFTEIRVGGVTATIRESVEFDLDASYLDRTLTIPAGLVPEDSVPGGLGNGMLQFVYTDSVTIMRNAALRDACGTDWVDVTDFSSDSVLAPAFQATDLRVAEPLGVLNHVSGEPRHVATSPDGSHYEVAIPAARLSPQGGFLDAPDAMSAMADIETIADVLLPADSGPLQVTIDLTDVLEAAAGEDIPEGDGMTVTWIVPVSDERPFDIRLPPEIADATCIDQDREA
ncbi:hypothetical protein [Jiangella alkaliphila]|uniref:hypothetical protein n=1 Tax=Jiangella alkaliphila TaxID=419479 RepID=UPI00128BFF40|nr:hypothetical protein [Jiangella alkaliphila]